MNLRSLPDRNTPRHLGRPSLRRSDCKRSRKAPHFSKLDLGIQFPSHRLVWGDTEHTRDEALLQTNFDQQRLWSKPNRNKATRLGVSEQSGLQIDQHLWAIVARVHPFRFPIAPYSPLLRLYSLHECHRSQQEPGLAQARTLHFDCYRACGRDPHRQVGHPRQRRYPVG